jgi:hypothetical protein
VPVEEVMKRTGISWISLGLLCVVLTTTLSGKNAEILKMGAARLDITPDEPVRMAGYSSRKELSTGIHDKLYVRVVAFEQGKNRLVLVSTDSLGFYRGTFPYMMEAIEAQFGLTSEEVILSAIHTHSAPTLTLDAEQVHPNNVRYTEYLQGRILEGIRVAMSDLRLVQVGVGRGSCAAGVNRREERPDGTIVLGRNPKGPHDREVMVVSFQDAGGQPRGLLYNYATHATSLGPANLQISGDLIGIASNLVEGWQQRSAVVAAFVGASGDIDPWYRVLPGFKTADGWVPETELLGRLLAVEVGHVLESIDSYSAGTPLDSMSRIVLLPGKERGKQLVEKGEELPPVPLRLSAARIGDIGILGMDAEVLTEVGLAIKQGSPFSHTFIVTHCNGAQGYLPPKHLYKEGGYEINTSPFAPGAGEIAVKEALNLLYELAMAESRE